MHRGSDVSGRFRVDEFLQHRVQQPAPQLITRLEHLDELEQAAPSRANVLI
ncbi:MAG: hypothetical protein JWP14_2771, partial [Frankiales bacterium]|nr:hypothetical protein [Frankiales bacterium]